MHVCLPVLQALSEHFPFSVLLKAALGILTVVLWEATELS